MTRRSRSVPQDCSGSCRRVPTARTTSASAQKACACGRLAASGCRPGSTPLPMRNMPHGRLQPFGDRLHLCRRLQRTTPGHDQRGARLRQPLGGAFHRLLIHRWRGRRGNGFGRRQSERASATHPSAPRYRRGGGRAAQQGEGAGQRIRHLGRAGDQRVHAAHAGKDGGLVADLVQLARHPPDLLQRDLPYQRENGGVGGIGRGEGGSGIQQPWPRNDRQQLRLASGQGGPQRHIARALLVPRVDHAQPVLPVEEGIEKGIVLHPRQAIGGGDAVGDQPLSDRLGGVRPMHQRANSFWALPPRTASRAAGSRVSSRPSSPLGSPMLCG